MTGRAAPLGIAMAVLVLSIALALVLIPVLDQQLRRTLARKEANSRKAAASSGHSVVCVICRRRVMGERHSEVNFTRTKSAARSTTRQRFRIWIDIAIRRNSSGRRLGSESSTRASRNPSSFATQSMVRIGSPKAADATLKPTRGFRGSAGMQSLLETVLTQFMHILTRSKYFYGHASNQHDYNLKYICADCIQYPASIFARAASNLPDSACNCDFVRQINNQSTNLTPIFRSLRHITSQRWLSESPAESRRNVSGGDECRSTSIIAPDLLRSQTRQSRLSCGAPKEICPALRAGLRGSSLKSSAIVYLRTIYSHDIGDCIKSKLPLKTVFAPTDALDIAGAA